MRKDLTIWKHHVESTLYLEVRTHPTWEGGFVETRRSAHSWMWRSVIIKDVTVLRSWSNFHNETELFLGFASWTESTKYVTETSEEIPVTSVENRGTGKLVAKTEPRPKPTLKLSLVSVPYRERKWIDVDPGKFSHGCFEVSKFMIRLLRHDDAVHREDDGAARFDDLHDRAQSLFSTHNLRLVLRKWYTCRLARMYTATYTNPQGYRESYSRQICNMDDRILLISKRDNPPTIKANKARSTRKLVAHISKKLAERSTKRLVAVTLITEFKVYLTQQSRKKTLITRKW